MIYITIILAVLVLALIYAVVNLLRKIERVEDAYIEVSNVNDTLYTALRDTLADMSKIDEQGTFQADDEIGSIFKQLHNTLKSVNSIFIKKNDE